MNDWDNGFNEGYKEGFSQGLGALASALQKIAPDLCELLAKRIADSNAALDTFVKFLRKEPRP